MSGLAGLTESEGRAEMESTGVAGGLSGAGLEQAVISPESAAVRNKMVEKLAVLMLFCAFMAFEF